MAENLYASTNVEQNVEAKEKTIDFFNGYFQQNIQVDAAQHQAVKSFFLRKTDNDQTTSSTLTDSLFEIALSGGYDIMSLIERLETENIDDVQKNLIAIINSYRIKTSVLGYSNSRTANPTVLRNIVE